MAARRTRPPTGATTSVPTRKLSETILDFAEPLLAVQLPPDQTRERLKLAIIVWNALALRSCGKPKTYDEMLRLARTTGTPGQAGLLIGILCQRYAERFASDVRLVGEWAVERDSDGHWEFTTETRMFPNSKQGRAARSRAECDPSPLSDAAHADIGDADRNDAG